MSDTIPLVRWSVDQVCALRTDRTLGDAGTAAEAVQSAAEYGATLADPGRHFGIYGDVCVTGLNTAVLRKGRTRGAYPIAGFLVSEAFAAVGGGQGLRQMCGACPANGSPRWPAGCAGTLLVPDNIEAELHYTVRHLDLAAVLALHFLPTTPLWYGLWTRKRLEGRPTELLAQLFDAIADQMEATTDPATDRWADDCLSSSRAFAGAAAAAARHGLTWPSNSTRPGTLTSAKSPLSPTAQGARPPHVVHRGVRSTRQRRKPAERVTNDTGRPKPFRMPRRLTPALTFVSGWEPNAMLPLPKRTSPVPVTRCLTRRPSWPLPNQRRLANRGTSNGKIRSCFAHS